VLLTIGLALALSAATALFRDMRHFVEVGLALGFWATPIFYRLDEVPRALQGTIAAMPLTPFVTAYHRMFFDQRWPEPAVLGLAVAYAVAALVLGTVLFQRVEDQLPERV
jgi:ABC-type polysaccharide/polyol phosphate export permease